MRRELILLGTGTSVGVPVIGCRCPVCTSTNPRNHRTRTGVFVPAPEGNFLIDTPPELRLQLLREKVELVHAAIFTHSHADHIFGLDDLRIFGYRLDRDIGLYCEEIVERQIRAAFSYAFAPADPDAHHFAVPKFAIRPMTTQPFTLLGQTVRPIRLMHGKLPILGFRLNDVAYCTDVSAIPEESWPLLEGLDTLVLDALRDQPHPTHFSVGQALEVIDRVKPRHAVLTHMDQNFDYRELAAELPPGVEPGYDGLSFELPDP